MKVLVYFQPNRKYDNYEGARMRKTIKGALEVTGATHTSNIYDDYDIAHFMSPEDESKLNIALERDVPVIVSALYGEDDPSARFLTHKSKDGKRTSTLKNRALKMLNKATLVLVPTESCSLLESMITTLKVFMPSSTLRQKEPTRYSIMLVVRPLI